MRPLKRTARRPLQRWHAPTGFCRYRGADQQNPPGNFGAESRECIGLLEKGHHLLELLFRIIDTRYIFEADLQIILRLDARLTTTKPKGTVRHLG